ncbi:Na+:solute symporter [candidate division KSB1 bacterium]|nr:Na+:solute symporter [candidate division KSB1 bacterium]
MTNLDWTIVILYLASAIGIGLHFVRKASRSTNDYFVAGRSLPWIVAGTSMVATSFSADTPLFVAGMTRESGIAANWFWWSAAIGQIATVFFFAKLWRRTEAVTDIEFVAQRYEAGAPRDALRVFKVVFDGVLINCTIMASVTLAMGKILTVMLNLSAQPLIVLPLLGGLSSVTLLLLVLGGIAVLYSLLSGLYGVVYTDLIQFSLAMIGSIGLAIIVYVQSTRGSDILTTLAGSPGFSDQLIDFFPQLNTLNLGLFTFFVYISVTWWAQAPGNGFMVQRLLATRSENDSLLAFLWYNFCHYVLRPWPWILVGIFSIVYYPQLADPESAFPLMIDRFLPSGLKGVMVAAMLAAFMSTIDTQLNWGTSYLINDLYRPYIRKKAPNHHYVQIARLSMLLLTLIFLLVTFQLQSILGVYKYLGVLLSGLGTVMIARWFWWRVNPWSEISALIAAFVVGNLLEFLLPSTLERDLFAVRVVISVIAVTVVWVSVTLLTGKKPGEQTCKFYRRMKIAGPGWKTVSHLTGTTQRPGELSTAFLLWVSCTIFFYSILLGIGKLLFTQWVWAGVYILIAFASGTILRKNSSSSLFTH